MDKFVRSHHFYNYSINNELKILNIALNINEGYCMQAGTTIVSVLENNKKLNLKFHIFIDDISKNNKKIFNDLAKTYSVDIHIYVMNMDEFKGFIAEKTRFTVVSLFRLCMSEIIKEQTDRFLYLDADVVCLHDLSTLVDMCMDDYVVAAVPDLAKERLEIFGIKGGRYFNSGVLLISCIEWEKENITDKLFAYRGKMDSRYEYPDQDLLNIVLNGKVQYLDKKYNFFGYYDAEMVSDCIIYHFIGREKPWKIALRDIEKKWRYYLSISPWPDIKEELPEKNPRDYFYYKTAAKYFFKQKNIIKAYYCLMWYSFLKIRK